MWRVTPENAPRRPALSSVGVSAGSYAVINVMLIGFMILSLVGVCYPLQRLPVLMLELLWKAIWLSFFALPIHLNTALDDYVAAVVSACMAGVVLTPLVLPWRYIFNNFFDDVSERYL
jgi:hypothetical protein